MTIPQDFYERVYAGVLGKIIGVYMGRPFEGWSHERIVTELGDIKYYVHASMGRSIIETDDDISGTFAFLRAMPDYGMTSNLTPAQIGQTWLNYLIEERTVLWWGGMGNSTEHTAYLRLKSGIQAPASGSIALNGQVVAEQIGAQIFIDGWGMICPGDPERAADLARRAGSVSHDGEAIYGAQVVAAMEAQAFVEGNIEALLDVGVSMIPADSIIARLIGDLRDWRGRYDDWHESFWRIVANYGYDKYGGNCHMIPNHALIVLALLYCEDRFDKALTIVNTAGWDTDCNSGNVGCLMGIKNGLAGLDVGPDLRGPVADRLYIPTADGGRTVTDAVREATEVVNIAHALAGEAPIAPKGGARYHFELPGSVQGFLPDDAIECRDAARVENVEGHSRSGCRSLAIHYGGLADGRCARVQRETLPIYQPTSGYRVSASPTLYAGQTIQAVLSADEDNVGDVEACLYVKAYGPDNALDIVRGLAVALAPGEETTLTWRVDVPEGCPIGWVGIELSADLRTDGTVYIDWLNWTGTPTASLLPGKQASSRWLSAWVDGCSRLMPGREEKLRLIQDEGTGLAIHGTHEWQDYAVCARMTPHMVRAFGLAARVQGLRRYYALELVIGGTARLVRELDGTHVLAETPYPWELYRSYELELRAKGSTIRGSIDGEVLFEVQDAALEGGAIGLLIEEGRLGCHEVTIAPLA